MFWAPYSSNELKTINAWFEQKNVENKNKENTMKNTIIKARAFLKSLIFDRTIVKKIQASRMNKHILNLYLQEGKISLNEYLYLNR